MIIKKLFSIVILFLCCFFSVKAQEVEKKSDWKLVWQDEFNYNGIPDTSKWDYEKAFLRDIEMQYYTYRRKKNSEVKDGSLHINAFKEEFPNDSFLVYKNNNWLMNYLKQYSTLPRDSTPAWIRLRRDSLAHYTSASITSKFSFKYGKVEVRAKLPSGLGVWPAIWMLGINKDVVGWPNCGEIDLMESLGRQPDVVMGGVHFGDTKIKSHLHKSNHVTIPNLSSDYHVYTVEWDKKSISFYIDNNIYFTYDSNDGSDKLSSFQKPFYLILNLALGGWGGKINDAVMPQSLVIDYVRIYQKVGALN